MKKNILITIGIILVTTLTSPAQRLNNKGQKMVSEIETQSICDNWDSRKKFVFQYDDNNSLIRMDVYSGLYHIYKEYWDTPYYQFMTYIYDNNTLKEIDLEIDETYKKMYYTFDSNGNLSEAIEELYYPEGVTRTACNMFYEYKEDLRDYLLSKTEVSFYVREADSDKFEKNRVVLSNDYAYIDGLLYTNGTKNKKYIKGPKNDTNISGAWLMDVNPRLRDGMLEWYHTRTNYFPQYDESYILKYDYHYDSKGNIIKIVRKEKKRDLTLYMVNIKYME